MRRLLPALILALTLPAPALAGPDKRCPSDAPEIHIAKTRDRHEIVRCDARGRAQVLRRVRYGEDLAGPLGTTLTDVAVRDSRVAWTELIHGKRGTLGQVVEADRRGMITRRRHVLAVGRGKANERSLEVELLAQGAVAWRAGARVAAARPGHSVRVLSRSGGSELTVEDGRTVRLASTTYVDVVSLPRGAGGCPARGRFTPSRITGEHVVSVARYPGDEETTVTRVCLRATGSDPVVAYDDTAFGFGTAGDLIALAGRFALVTSVPVDRYRGCLRGEARTVDLRSGRAVRAVRLPEYDCVRLPTREAPAAIADNGAFAWLSHGGSELLAAGPDGAIATLGSSRPGTFSDLAVTGETFTWRADGQPQSAPAR